MPLADINLNRLIIFKEVAQAGSFSRAAANLRQPKSRISRNMAALEAELGVQLVYRTTRQFQLTPAGQDLFHHAAPLLRELASTIERIAAGEGEVAGPLKISVPEDFGVELMGAICHSFMARYPRVAIDLHVGNQMVDLVRESFDLALRIGRLQDSSLLQRRVGQINLLPYVSPALLERHGGRFTPDDLAKLPCLLFSTAGTGRSSLELVRGKETKRIAVKPVFACNNFFVLRSLAIAGDGFAELPPFVAAEAVGRGQLVPALQDWVLEGSPVQVVMPNAHALPLRTRVFIDHLTESLTAAI